MADHVMKTTRIPGAIATNDGYVLCFVEQVTDAAVANNDTVTFKEVHHVIPIGIVSEIASVIDFDASAASTNDWVMTVNTTVITTGTAATSIKGLALVKFR